MQHKKIVFFISLFLALPSNASQPILKEKSSKKVVKKRQPKRNIIMESADHLSDSSKKSVSNSDSKIDGETPVISLSIMNRKQFIEALKAGSVIVADPYIKEINATHLIFAALNGDAEMVLALLKSQKNINIQAKDINGYTALHHATSSLDNDMNNAALIVFALIDAGADVNAQTLTGNTALHHAAAIGNKEIISKLRFARANNTITNNAGKKPFEIAKDQDIRLALMPPMPTFNAGEKTKAKKSRLQTVIKFASMQNKTTEMSIQKTKANDDVKVTAENIQQNEEDQFSVAPPSPKGSDHDEERQSSFNHVETKKNLEFSKNKNFDIDLVAYYNSPHRSFIMSILLDPANLNNINQVKLIKFLLPAIQYDDEQVIDAALKRNDIDWKLCDQESGHNVLTFCARHGSQNMIQKLLDSKKIDVDIPDSKERTALMHATIGDHSYLVSTLIENGANVNKQDKNGVTALLQAVSANAKQSTYILLACGALCNAPDIDGITPLMEACKLGHIKIIKILIEHNSELKNMLAENPKYLADIGKGEPSETTKKECSIEFLDKSDERFAATTENEFVNESYRFVLNRLVGIDLQDNNGMTALMFAVRANCIEAVEVILNNYSKLLLKNRNGHTALELAQVAQKNIDILRPYDDAELSEVRDRNKEIIKLLTKAFEPALAAKSKLFYNLLMTEEESGPNSKQHTKQQEKKKKNKTKK